MLSPTTFIAQSIRTSLGRYTFLPPALRLLFCKHSYTRDWLTSIRGESTMTMTYRDFCAKGRQTQRKIEVTKFMAPGYGQRYPPNPARQSTIFTKFYLLYNFWYLWSADGSWYTAGAVPGEAGSPMSPGPTMRTRQGQPQPETPNTARAPEEEVVFPLFSVGSRGVESARVYEG